MEKIKVNNQIVSMRKFVKQAKVHTINKLVKQIKLLQNRKGNEVQIQKAKRKAERFLEAVTLMKKIRPDDVSKLALSKAKDWKNVLQQKNCPLHDRCIAMLANYGAVQKEVEAFHSTNQELVLKITDLVKQWEEKNKVLKDLPKTKKMSSVVQSSKGVEKVGRTNKKLSNDIKNRLNIEVTNIKSNDDVENSLDAKNNNNNEENTLQISDSHNNNNEQKIEMNESHKVLPKNMMEDNDSENSMESEDSDSSAEEEAINDIFSSEACVAGNEAEDQRSKDSDKNKQQTLVLNFIEKQSKLKNDNKNKLKAIALLNLNELEGLDEIPVNISYDECDEERHSEDEINETSCNKNSDPFFLEPGSKDSIDNELINPFENNSVHPRSKNPTFEEREKKNGQRSKNQFSPKKNFKNFPSRSKTVSQEFENDSNDYKSFKRDKFMSKNYNKFQERNESVFDRSSNTNQKGFKMYPPRDNFGKKKYENISKNSHYRNENNSSITKKVPHKKDPASDKPLHPSWEAKKKQKELVNKSFQGKRIVFGD